ncbi:MAG: alpha/beta fold hydrolase, partial [Alphaproteobacteria bacterium]|nr:alpha/beta fold hydrolase [Alphaproteobacteria bacterium]
MTIHTEKVFFANHQGHLLSGRLITPEKPKAFGIFAHCFTCTKDITAAFAICKSLASHGIAMLRFDFTGIGESEGTFFESSLSNNITDIHAAYTYMCAQNQEPTLLVGHSLGGLTSLYAAQTLPKLKGVVTLNAPFTTRQTLSRFEQDIEQVKQAGFGDLNVMGKLYQVSADFVHDALQYMDFNIQTLDPWVLVMHALKDDIVPFDHALEISQKIQSPCQMMPLMHA